MIYEILGLYEVNGSSMTLLYPTPYPGVVNLDPRDTIDRIYVGDH